MKKKKKNSEPLYLKKIYLFLFIFKLYIFFLKSIHRLLSKINIFNFYLTILCITRVSE